MQLPDYFMPRPAANYDAETIAAFEHLYATGVEHGSGAKIEYALTAPKWQFLCYLCDHKNLVMHGSGRADITEFEPRKANDVHKFGDRCAVYAAVDGLWAMYFAIVDRDKYVTSLVNGCFRVVETHGGMGKPHYFFSINGDAFSHNPWRKGMVYLLSGTGFEQQQRERYRGMEIEIPQRASLVPVRPLAKIVVCPEDFPFLAQIRGHNPATLQERALADPAGYPWLDEMV